MWLIRILAGEGLVQTHGGLWKAQGELPTRASRGCNASPLPPFQFKANSYNETLMLHLFISISNLLNTVSTHAVLTVLGALGRAGC